MYPVLIRGKEDVTMGARMMALVVAAALLATGPLSPVVAQQAAQPATQPELSPDAVPAVDENRYRGPDFYTAGATIITVAKAPFNVVLCGVGGMAGAALFLITLGTAYKAATRAVEEGCRGPWIVTSDDIRPDRTRSVNSYGMGSP